MSLMQARFYTANDLADLLKRSRRTIWNWVREGRLPRGHLIGTRSRYWTESELEEFFRKERAA